MSEKPAPREYDTITYYRGRPVSEMSRIELIAALQDVGQMLERERENHIKTLEIWTKRAKARQL